MQDSLGELAMIGVQKNLRPEMPHETLEDLACITQAKQHPQELKKTKSGGDGHLGNVIWMDRHLMAPTDQIDLREDSQPEKSRSEVKDLRDQVPSQDQAGVKLAVFTAGPPVIIHFGSQMQG